MFLTTEKCTFTQLRDFNVIDLRLQHCYLFYRKNSSRASGCLPLGHHRRKYSLKLPFTFLDCRNYRVVIILKFSLLPPQTPPQAIEPTLILRSLDETVVCKQQLFCLWQGPVEGCCLPSSSSRKCQLMQKGVTICFQRNVIT